MRNVNRIKPLAEKFAEAWALVPDWRMGQLFSNLMGAGRHDVFNVEDEDWDKLLDAFIKEWSN